LTKGPHFKQDIFYYSLYVPLCKGKN